MSKGNSFIAGNGDGDDVYYRFGGAVICDMMQLRYKALKKCTLIRRSEILKEIEILESMNDKKKECMPEYLKYRDKGYMYSPVKESISFFRAVDDRVREQVNEIGFQEHGSNLVTVSYSFIHLKY